MALKVGFIYWPFRESNIGHFRELNIDWIVSQVNKIKIEKAESKVEKGKAKIPEHLKLRNQHKSFGIFTTIPQRK